MPNTSPPHHDRAPLDPETGAECWLGMVLGHHRQIETAFTAVARSATAGTRRLAQHHLVVLLTAHSLAEESVLYGELTLTGRHSSAEVARAQQATSRRELAQLDALDPLGEDYLDRIAQLQSAFAVHVHQEEQSWFAELRREGDGARRLQLTERYAAEFQRHLQQAPVASPMG